MRIEKSFIENHISDIVECYDTECRRIYVNAEWERLNKLKARECIDKTPIEIPGIMGSFAQKYQTKLQKILTSGIPDEWDMEFEKDNKKCVYSYRAIPEYDQFKKINCLLVTGRNITFRKEKEEENLSNIMGLFFEKEFVAMGITTPDKFWYRVNNKFTTLLGYSFDELKKMTWVDITHPKDLEKTLDLYDKMIFGEVNEYTIKKRFIHKNGSVINVKIFVNCVRDTNGSVDYILSLVEDITEQVKTEKILEEDIKKKNLQLEETIGLLNKEIAERKHTEDIITHYKKELEDITNSIPGFVYKYQHWNSGKEEFLFASNGIEEIYGITAEEALKDISHIRKAIHPEERQEFVWQGFNHRR